MLEKFMDFKCKIFLSNTFFNSNDTLKPIEILPAENERKKTYNKCTNSKFVSGKKSFCPIN